MDLFKGIEKATARRNKPYEGPGSYIQIIENVKSGTTRKGAEFVVIEKRVISCLDVATFTEFNGEKFEHHRVGDSVSDMMMSAEDYFFPTFKSFLTKVVDDPKITIDEDFCLSILDDGKGNPSCLAGIIVRMNNRQGLSKKGVVITYRNYEERIRYRNLEKYMEGEEIMKWVPDYEKGLENDM